MTFTAETSIAVTANATLRRGDTGNEVRALQVTLNYRGAGLTDDGVFGALTEARVREFQQARQLTVDGVVGSNTWDALQSGMARVRTAGSTINMRATPELTGKIVQTLVSEDSVRVIGRSPLMDDNYRWFFVEARQSQGWVRENLIDLLGPAFTVPLPMVNGITIQSRPRSWNMGIDPRIEAGIRSVLNLGEGDRLRYLYFGLNNADNAMLVYLPGDRPTGGSPLMVMRPTGRGYKVISNIVLVEQPVIITNDQSFGYPDLVVHTTADGVPPNYRRLRFTGSTYHPSRATTAIAIPAGSTVRGIALATRITPELAAPIVAV
jgi:hypothetical protein